MAYRIPQFGLTGQVKELIAKMRDTDFDLRTMALMDLNKELSRQPPAVVVDPSTSSSSSSRIRQEIVFIQDDTTEKLLCDEVVKLLNDPISEVKNMAVNCAAGLSRRPRSRTLKTIFDNLMLGIAATDEEQRDISCLALKSVVAEMPRDERLVEPYLKTISEQIFKVLTQPDPNPQLASELLQILSDLYSAFPNLVAQPAIQSEALKSLVTLLNGSRISIRKRAVPALTALVSTDPRLFDEAVKQELVKGLAAGGETGRIWVSVVASLAKGQSVGQIGGLLGEGKPVGMILGQCDNLEETDTVEGALSALEVLVLRCPTEMSPSIDDIVQKSLELVKYDPNYVEQDDDEDDVDMNDDEDDDNDFDDDDYSDSEDDSWRIRRTAAKLLQAVFGTRNDLLTNFYDNAAGTLIGRFNEREESVRFEVMDAFEALLKQTAVSRNAEIAIGSRNKRKRSHDMDEDAADDSATGRLEALMPQLIAAILKQLGSKSEAARQQSFTLLREIADILQGGLETSSDAICTSAVQGLRTVDSTASSAIALAALSFLSTFFVTHSPRTFASHVDDLVKAITRCMRDKLHRISAEAFSAASSLAQTARPKGSASPLNSSFSQPIKSLFQATTDVLADTSVDSDIRERALETLGHLLVHEGDSLTSSFPSALPLIKSRLGNEATSGTAIQVIGRIAEAPTCAGDVFDKWLLDILPDVLVAVRRSKRASGKNAEFACLQHILTRISSSLPTDTANALVAELKSFIEVPSALQAAVLVLDQQPGSRQTVTDELLPGVKALVQTPAISTHLVDSLAAFFGSYVKGDPKAATSLVSELVAQVETQGDLPDATKGGTSVHSSTSRCIGSIASASEIDAAGILSSFQKTIKSSKASESQIYLALLSIGEIGRTSDLSSSQDLFDRVIEYMSQGSEEVRSAAAFAAGNMAVGSPQVFLPSLIKQMESTSSASLRILFLHSLKEVILHSSPAQLEILADQLWQPLFSGDMSTGTPTSNSDNSVRNVKAACIGKLTTTAPSKFLPQLQELLKSSPENRAIVAAAVRYTFIDTSSSYDELIAPVIVDFLSLMHDDNIVVRRLSLASLNAAIQNKPHLIIDKLNALQPLLYQETVVREELRRVVQMGPWKTVEDDGLENRKTALETMYTLLGTCFNKIDLPTFIERVLAALKDHDEVKPLALMLLLRLGQLAPTSIIPRLEDTVGSFQDLMKDIEVKEDTVKQDLERKEEMQRSALRAAVPLYKLSSAAQAPQFHAFVAKQLSADKWREFRDYRG